MKQWTGKVTERDQDKEGNSDLRGGGVTVNWEKREEYSKEKRSRRNAKIGGAT